MSFIPADVGIHVTPYETSLAQTALSPKSQSKRYFRKLMSAYEPLTNQVGACPGFCGKK